MELFEKGRQCIYNMMPSAAKTYNGLMNQGATCYLNSVLQVLFMTEDFREAVKRYTCDHSDPELIDRHLTTLFDDLQEYEAYTYKITHKLCIDNVYEQRDAAEYFEKILGLTSREASQIFHGQQTQKTICSTCCTETGSETPFWNLTLALVNSYTGDFSVVSGIEEYFRASYFSGENQMYCDECQHKSDATIKWEIKDHPEVLMLLLKRFEFDYRYMTYVKINCSVNVPCSIQIPENQTYELYAVVDHFGDLRSGHYTATIKPQDSARWYTFNDATVTLLDYQPFQVDNVERFSSAYLLFYRKKKEHAADTCNQDTGELSSPGGFPPATRDVYSDQFEAEERRATEKVEWAAKHEQTIHRNAKTEITDVVVVGSSGVGRSDLYKEVQDNGVYSRQSSNQNCEKDMNELSYSAEKLKDMDKIMMDDEKEKRGNAQADHQTVGRESVCGKTPLKESIDGTNDVRPEDVIHRKPQEGQGGEDMLKQEVSNMHPQQVCVDMQKDKENMAKDLKRDKSGMKGRGGISPTLDLDEDEARRDDEGLDHGNEPEEVMNIRKEEQTLLSGKQGLQEAAE
ncbi:ubiquitin carboxyl-terminal hydrolase 48-like [Clinocottus analis]|uniref:ubiquitin carboxyl-terminal hydrolase 48-like n=1 Tax=Clinocottus analis TaxID=304258 RepID=UPI0035BFBD7A